jgi:hypothetical protein
LIDVWKGYKFKYFSFIIYEKEFFSNLEDKEKITNSASDRKMMMSR